MIFCKHTHKGNSIFSRFICSTCFNPELGPLQMLFNYFYNAELFQLEIRRVDFRTYFGSFPETFWSH
jgi:hypothetical protein